MDSSQKTFLAHLEEREKDITQREARFREEGRADESVFENIRLNIYEIFTTVFGVAEKNCGGDRAALRDFFLQKMEQIPENWKLSFEKAKEHGDAKKMHIEGIKLETAQEIRNIFEEDIM